MLPEPDSTMSMNSGRALHATGIAQWGRALLPVFIALFVAAFVMMPAASHAKPKKSTHHTSKSKLPNPDTLLTDIYKDLTVGDLRSALAKADRLVEAYPKFQLAHLIRGDLLMMHAHPVTTIGAGPDGAASTKLLELRTEAIARLKTLYLKRDPDLYPRAFTQLRESHQYAVLVDTSQSRMFVYKNKGGKLSLLNHYYVSQGKLGVHKTREGDQKTPVGIYRITSRIPQAKLPDFYGAGALPLNYPNDWEKIHGRGGSGIWLHGMPSESFSRPPLASDGCVALTNPDMSELASTLDIYKTLVVISDRAELANDTLLKKDRKLANDLLEKWRRDVEYGNRKFLLKHYSAQFRSNTNEDLNTWFDKQPHTDPNTKTTYKVHNLSLMRYPGPDNMIAAAFNLDVKRGSITSQTRRFQLWAKEGSQWKIIYENTIKDFL
jgi:murein L,D-transpeptidase YafK